jgi:hypothetical protein
MMEANLADASDTDRVTPSAPVNDLTPRGGRAGIIALLARTDQAGNAQYPAFHLRQRAFGRRVVGVQEARKFAIPVGARRPGRDAVGVMLVAGAILVCEVASP